MKQRFIPFLLVAALGLPVLLFLSLRAYAAMSPALAAAAAIALGWALNIAWALATQAAAAPAASSPEQRRMLTIAARFGWACPAVLVLLTWVASRFVA